MRGIPTVLYASIAVVLLAAAPAAAQVAVAVTPGTAQIRLGAKLDFNSAVSNTTNKSVTWRVNDIAGGNATVGTIDGNGLYQAPAAMPASGGAIRIKAVSVADPNRSGSAAVTLLNPVPRITELVPYSVNQGLGFTLVVKGTSFVRGARIQWDATALATTFVSDTELRATSITNAPPSTYINLMVLNPDPGAASSNVKQVRVLAPVSVNVWPDTRTMRAGASYDFGVSISNHSDKTVTWFVNDVKGGNAALGTVDAEGIYKAPDVLPTGNSVNLKAVSNADPRMSDTTPITLLNPLPVVTKVNPGALLTGAGRTFSLEGTGFIPGSKVAFDDQVLATVKFVSPLRIDVTTDVPPALGGYSRVAVTNADPGGSKSADFAVAVTPSGNKMTYAAAVRFLEQASWGPTPATVARVMEIGREAWITEQFAAPMSIYTDPADMDQGLSSLQKQFFRNAFLGGDQLRQRAAFALGQIFVVSGVDLGRYWQMVPWQRLMMNNAFGGYNALMKEVTLSPAMGEYLDMVNNDKPNPARGLVPNENYGRELLQLFTLGLFALNPDGTRQTNAGQPVPSYTEDHVKQVSLAFTGWTYPPQPGFASKWTNPRYYYGRMIPFEDHHDLSAKTILPGVTLPAGQTAEQDVNAALAAIFNHSNLGPFVATRLIQKFVTSNPSPEYVGRVAAAFNSPVRGDLKNTLRAILLDPEAGTGPDAPAVLPSGQGHLREPVLFSLSLLRALGATVTEEPNLPYITETMGQKLFFSPSVFNYFSPLYRIPGAGVPGPEFQILNPTTALGRVNFVHRAVNNSISSTVRIPVAHFAGLAQDPAILLKAVGNALLRGPMPSDMEQSILKAILATTDRNTRARNALYLAASQSRYQVQR